MDGLALFDKSFDSLDFAPAITVTENRIDLKSNRRVMKIEQSNNFVKRYLRVNQSSQ